MPLIKQIYKPTMTVGQVYARPYGTAAARAPVGNVLLLELSHEEDIKTQQDMTRLGGGTYTQVRRVKQVGLKIDFADWNPVNFTRAVWGTVATVPGAAVVDEPQKGYKGGLTRLNKPQPTAVTVKVGATTIAADQYEVRPEGIWVPETSTIADAADLLVSYTHPEHVNIEAITTGAPEIELSFGGLNEAESGKPVIVDVWRLGAGIAKQLALIQSDFGKLSIEGEVMRDPTKTGAGISPYYRTQQV